MKGDRSDFTSGRGGHIMIPGLTSAQESCDAAGNRCVS